MAQNNLMAALSYLFGWVSGLIVFLISKDDRFARFHALQSILFNIAEIVIIIGAGIIGFVLSFILIIIAGMTNIGVVGLLGAFAVPIVLLLIVLAIFLVWVWCMFQAFSGNWFKLPVIGGLAESWAR